MTKTPKNALLAHAMAGLMAGALVACGGSAPEPAEAEADPASVDGRTDMDEAGHADVDAKEGEQAADGAENSCKGKDGCKGKDEAHADMAEGEQAAEIPAHECRGMNECKGQGGCGVEGQNTCRGQNPCKGKGGCKTS